MVNKESDRAIVTSGTCYNITFPVHTKHLTINITITDINTKWKMERNCCIRHDRSVDMFLI